MHFFVLADPLFQDGDPLVKDRRNQTQDNDGHYHLVHTEGLLAVDDQISKSGIRSQKFTDDNAYQTEPYVYLHAADDDRNGRGQEDLEKDISPGSAKSPDQFDLFRIGLLKVCKKGHDGAEEGHRNGCDYDGFPVISQPYDQKWSQGRLGKAV